MSTNSSDMLKEIIVQLLAGSENMQMAANKPPQGDVRPLQLINGQWVPSRGIGPGRIVTPYDNPPPRPQPRLGTDADFLK